MRIFFPQFDGQFPRIFKKQAEKEKKAPGTPLDASETFLYPIYAR